jgi:hypothetical protein
MEILYILLNFNFLLFHKIYTFQTADGEILTWGRSLDCQLGHGTKADKLLPTQIVGPIGVTWASVRCGK